MADWLRNPQTSLFPKDWATELARDLLDTAWLVMQHRTYLTEALFADLRALLAYFREMLVARAYAERMARDAVAGLAMKPRFGLKARPAPPPTLARIA